METDQDKLLALIYTGDETNIRLALQMGRATGVDMQSVYRQLQDCVDFLETHYKVALSIPEIIRRAKTTYCNCKSTL